MYSEPTDVLKTQTGRGPNSQTPECVYVSPFLLFEGMAYTPRVKIMESALHPLEGQPQYHEGSGDPV